MSDFVIADVTDAMMEGALAWVGPSRIYCIEHQDIFQDSPTPMRQELAKPVIRCTKAETAISGSVVTITSFCLADSLFLCIHE